MRPATLSQLLEILSRGDIAVKDPCSSSGTPSEPETRLGNHSLNFAFAPLHAAVHEVSRSPVGGFSNSKLVYMRLSRVYVHKSHTFENLEAVAGVAHPEETRRFGKRRILTTNTTQGAHHVARSLHEICSCLAFPKLFRSVYRELLLVSKSEAHENATECVA